MGKLRKIKGKNQNERKNLAVDKKTCNKLIEDRYSLKGKQKDP